MAEDEKNTGFLGPLTNGISEILKIISVGIFSPISEGTNLILNKIESRIVLMEKRILKKISSLIIMVIGGVFFMFSFFFFMTESFGWSNASASLALGLIVFIAGFIQSTRSI